MIISFSLNPNRRKYPANLFYNLCVASIALAVVYLLEEFYGKYNFLCHNGKPSDQSFAPCAVQGNIADLEKVLTFMPGAFILFFGLAAILWWLLILVNVYLLQS